MLPSLLSTPFFSPGKPPSTAQTPYTALQSHVPAHAWHVTTTFSARTKVKWWENDPDLAANLIKLLTPIAKDKQGNSLSETTLEEAIKADGITPKSAKVASLRLAGELSTKEIAKQSDIDTQFSKYIALVSTQASLFKKALKQQNIYFEYPEAPQEGERALKEQVIPLIRERLTPENVTAEQLASLLSKMELACLLQRLQHTEAPVSELAQNLNISKANFDMRLTIVRRKFVQAGLNDEKMDLLYGKKARKARKNRQ